MSVYNINVSNVTELESDIRHKVNSSRFLVAITGAGISRACGLPLIDDEVDGVPLRAFFRPQLFEDDAAGYYGLYRKTLQNWRTAKPSLAHVALAKAGFWVVTQNIDGLHRDAGSTHVLELHGNLRELLCQSCGHRFSSQLIWEFPVPKCSECNGVLHPGIVLEGEEVRHFSRAVDWVGRAECLFIVGTQLEMEPVRQLPAIAERNGADVIWLNSEAERMVPRLLSIPVGPADKRKSPPQGRTFI